MGTPLCDIVAGAYYFANYAAANVPPLRSWYDVQLEHFHVGQKSKTLGVAEFHHFKHSGDNVFYDVGVDGSMRINSQICAQPDIYYFSFPVCGTVPNAKGKQVPKKSIIKGLYLFAYLIGRFEETTEDGYTVDDQWLPNDGVVNTLSARAPSTEPSVDYDFKRPVQKGVWNVMPVVSSDHGAVIGWFRQPEAVLPMYLAHVKRIEKLTQKEFGSSKG